MLCLFEMAHRQSWVRMGPRLCSEGEGAVVHAQWREHFAIHPGFISLAGNRFDHLAQQRVADVGVTETATRHAQHPQRCGLGSDGDGQRRIHFCLQAEELMQLQVLQPGAVRQKVTHAHRMRGFPRIVELERRHHRCNRRIQ
ncbi:hypothetical protein D3C81_1393310 [compost metagenome]